MTNNEPSPSSSRPLPFSPELEILRYRIAAPTSSDGTGDAYLAYRVHNYRTLRSGRVITKDAWSYLELLWSFGIVGRTWVLYHRRAGSTSWADPQEIICCAAMVLLLILKSRTVLYETVLPLPGLGLQQDITRGFSFPALWRWKSRHAPHHGKRLRIPISVTHTFRPLTDISTIVINEGMTRWSVRFYLAVLLRKGAGVLVLLDNVRPSHAVLKEVYHGVREELFDEWTEGPESSTHSSADSKRQ